MHRIDPNGTVRDWLVAPVWSRPCEDLDRVLAAHGEPWGPDGRWVLTNGPDVAPLKRRLLDLHPLVEDQVTVQQSAELVEDGPLRWQTTGGQQTAKWSRRHVGTDGFVDWSEFCFTPEYREAVAATRLEVDQAEERLIEVACTGPFLCWVGGELVLRHDEFSYMEPKVRSVPVRLESGTTDVVIATWQVAFRECRHIVGLRVLGLPVRVVIPNPAADEYRSAVAERVLEHVGSRSWAVDGPTAELTGPPGTALRVTVGGRTTQQVRIGADGTVAVPLSEYEASTGHPTGDTTEADEDLASASMLTTGETALDVRIDDEATPVSRRLFVARLPAAHRTRPTGGPDQWRREVLEHVARHRGTTAAVLAQHALSADATVDEANLRIALHRITTRGDCADFEVVGLMHLWHRLPPQAWPDGLRQRIEDTLAGMKYWITHPGLDAMCYFTENHQLVWHVAQRLAGSAWPDRRFGIDGRTGAEHAEEGRRRAAAWIRRKLDGGFSEFDSNAYLAIDALALVSLVEFDSDEELRAGAEALLDKTLLSLASNSWRGVHGSAHGRSYVQTLRTSRLEETAPILWLLAGVGALNEAVLPVTALATARAYRLPEIIRRLAAGAGQPADAEPTQWWGRQVYRGDYAFERDLLSRPYGSDLRVWRTPGAMLSSVQDYRAGLPGLQEHIWGATLGSEVQVFATHPANSDNGSSARPNAWAGQRVLPHARQDRDAVLVLHAFPVGDPESRTHLWLPVAQCDEWRVEGSWVAARVDTGFVAVATPGGVRPAPAGDTAWQEWIPAGPGTAWVATVGWAGPDAVDPADAFIRWVSQLAEPSVADGQVSWTAPDGRTLQLSWDGTFLRNGEAVDLDPTGRPEHPPHLDNPSTTCRFGDRLLDAEWAGERLVLDLHAGRRLVPDSGVAATGVSALTGGGVPGGR